MCDPAEWEHGAYRYRVHTQRLTVVVAVGIIPVDRHGYGVASIPAGPFGSYRVIDHTRRLARQVPAP